MTTASRSNSGTKVRIGFTGAGGTGKSTLAQYISEKWGLPFHPSVSRQVFKEMGIECEADQNGASPALLYKLQMKIFQRKCEQDKNVRHGVLDRTLLDHFVYSCFRCFEILTAEEVNALEQLVIENLTQYNAIFYCPFGQFTPPPDGMRDTRPAYHNIIDLAVRGFLQKHPINTLIYTVDFALLNSRKAFIDSAVSECIGVTT